MMNRSGTLMILQDEVASLEHADFCSVPGYLVLRVRTGAESFGDLSSPGAQRLGGLLASAASAVETVVKADRVYCLSFCEVDRGLHFHLFPRTAELLEHFRQETGSIDTAIDGPALFTWAREAFPAGTPVPGNWPDVQEVCAALREMLDPA